MPRRNKNARRVVRGLEWKGRHRLDHREVIELPSDDEGTTPPAVPAHAGPQPAATPTTPDELRGPVSL